ncbi:MAG: nickel-dependent lactate racemase [Treponema sp.]|jgi:nickel-dependent lactate racemase|nr:nickel-dependent lactate racemase [Treponema sp.]
MPLIAFPYGKEMWTYNIPENRFKAELVSRIHRYEASSSQEELVRQALENPVGTPRLRVMAEGKKRVVIIASDHTRPVPSKVIIPRMLAEIRAGNPHADVTILIATGCHRGTTRGELTGKFGAAIVEKGKILIHDCDSPEMVSLGKLPSGGNLIINRAAMEADLLTAEGFIEPHFFAGYSGGRKSVLPGIVSRETVLYNHNAEFIASPYARTGIVDGNPIHADMLYAARAARLAFICNVIINSEKEVIHAVAGDAELAHRAGREFLAGMCQAEAVPADIIIAANGGYPLDQNIYQAVKGMTAAEATVKKNGVIIMLAKSDDGHGGEEFYKTFAEEKDLARMTETFLKTPRHNTRVDQWESQILARILLHARVVYVSGAPDDMVREFQMIPAHSLEDAVKKAEELLDNPQATITAIPDGIAVMVKRAKSYVL